MYKSTYQPRKLYQPPSISILGSKPAKEIDPGQIEQLFSIVLDGDYNKIKGAISEKNINFGVKNENGQSLIHIVLENNSSGMKENEKYDLIKYLIDHGAPVGAYDKNNVTVLHLATKYQYPKIVELLLNSGMNANVLDASNMTPLHYAVQGNITTCKPRKKVGSLIPKPIDKSITNKELNKLTVKIIEELSKDDFKQYISHIRNTLKEIGDIYYIDFEGKLNVLTNDISKIIADDKTTQESKKTQIKQKISSFSEDLNNYVRNELKSTLVPLNIGLQDPSSNNVLPKPTLEEKLQTWDDNFKAEKMKVFDEINKLNGSITNIINFKENTLYDKIHNIILLNKSAEVNKITDIKPRPSDVTDIMKYIKDPNNYTINRPNFNIDTKTLETLILNENSSLFPFYEINIINKIKNDPKIWDKFLPQQNNNIYSTYRFLKKDLSQKNINKLKKIPLTDDRMIYYSETESKYKTDPLNYKTNGQFVFESFVGDDANNNLNLLKTAIPQEWKNSDMRIKQSGGDFKGQAYYYISKFIYTITQIHTHYKVINNNIGVLEKHVLKNSYNYRAYEDLIPNLVLSVYNTYQNILLAHKERSKIITQTLNIKQQFETRLNNNLDHPYAFILENAIDECDEINKLINEIMDSMDQLYQKLHNFIDILNKLIDVINKQSGLFYIDAFMNTNFTDKKMKPYFDVFTKTLPNITIPPKDLDLYIKEFGQYGENIDLMRQNYYNKYCLYIDQTKYNIEYIKQIPDPTKPDLDADTRDNSNTNPNDNKFKNVPLSLPLTTKDGFLTTECYDRENDKLTTFNSYADSLKKLKLNLLYDKIGYPGVINTISTSDKSMPAISSIGKTLDSHLYNVKYWIIQNMIKNLKNDKEFTDNIKSFGWNQNPEIIVASTIGKITDELIINNIKNSIAISANKYSHKIASQYDSKYIPEQIQLDVPFGINLNELYDDIIKDVIITGGPSSNDFNLLMHTVNVMEDEEKVPDQFQIYNPNYTMTTNITEQQCYKIDPDIIKLLIKHGADVNKRDNAGASPLIYAIDTLHKDSIDTLLSHKLTNVSASPIKNMYGITPKQHALNVYSHHIGSLINNSSSVMEIVNKFTEPIYKNVKDNLEMNADFKNNIIKYLDIVFPQLIIMYNNLLYFYSKSYINNWSYEDQSAVEGLLLSNGLLSNIDIRLPVLQDFDKNIIKNSVNLDAFTKSVNTNDGKITKKQSKIDKIQNMINNLEKEKNSSKSINTNYLNDKINKLKSILKDKDTKKTSLVTDNKFLNTKLDDIIDRLHNIINIRTKNFIENKNYLGKTSQAYDTVFNEVSKVYQDMFKYVIQSIKIPKTYSGHEDYFLYNRLWREVINNPDKLKNVCNIQLLLALLEKKYVEKLQKPSRQELISINNDLSIISKLYNTVFIPVINNSYELPQYYNPVENYMLTETLDIIKHIVKQVLCSNLYYAVVKVITKHFATIKQPDITQNLDTIKQNLRKHIIERMPKELVKIKTKLYENETEEQAGLKTDDTLFQTIINIIIKTYSVPKDSSLITNLENYVFKYYKTLFDLVIPKMKTVIDNYNRFIVNEGRIVDIVVKINNRVITDMK